MVASTSCTGTGTIPVSVAVGVASGAISGLGKREEVDRLWGVVGRGVGVWDGPLTEPLRRRSSGGPKRCD